MKTSFSNILKNVMGRIGIIAAVGCFTIGSVIGIFFTIFAYKEGYHIWGASNIDFDITSQFGTFVGGVVGTFFTLAGAILIYLTFREQIKQSRKNHFEAKFYEMIRIHRENTREIKVNDYEGRAAVEELLKIYELWFAKNKGNIKRYKAG